MHEMLLERIRGLRLGRLKSRAPLALIPVFFDDGDGPEYLTLGEALERGVLSVTEVSEGGYVPELRVVNTGNTPVLLLDGEELKGAKQNRVVNTTILVPEKSNRIIPVSCTERGRWHAVSEKFSESGVVMACNIRAQKSRSVARSIAEEGTFRSDQDQVWAKIDDMARNAGVRSRTDAMRDVFSARERDLDKLVSEFSCAKDQRGLIAFIHGEVAGLELLSSVRAFALLFPKLLRSYAMEALTAKGDKRRAASVVKAKAFLDRLSACGVSGHPSVGYGEDLRFRGEGLVGSALTYKNTLLHAALFALPAERPGMEPLSRRRMTIEESE